MEKFEGPLGLLLQLIEEEELSVSEISLSKIADQFIEYLNEVAAKDPEELADFLVVAAKLLFLKSRELLPGLIVPEEEGPSLELQLKMYKIFFEAARNLETFSKRKQRLFFREKMAAAITPRFSPPPLLDSEKLRASFLDVLERITPIIKYPEERMRKTVSIQEKINRIKALIEREATVRFNEILKESKSRTEVVVNFLALLELVRSRLVSAEQDSQFGDILIRRQDKAASAAAGTEEPKP
jgi:segregation and condensation protein A